MVTNYKKIDLFGKSFIQKIALKPPFRFDFPVNEQACFLFVKEGEFQYQFDSEQRNIPANYSLFLNCIKSFNKTATWLKIINNVDYILYVP